jgi:hypothetical protein
MFLRNTALNVYRTSRRAVSEVVSVGIRGRIANGQPRQSQSHITTDGQSASLSWCQHPSGTRDQFLPFCL